MSLLMAGISRLIRSRYPMWAQKKTAAAVAGGGPSGDGILMESGDYILMESGDYILME